MTDLDATTAEDDRDTLRAMLMQAPAAICILSGIEHTCTLANAKYERLVGKTGLTGKPVHEALPEIEGQGTYKLLDRIYTTGEPFVGAVLTIGYRPDDNSEPVIGYFNFVYQPIRKADGTVTDILVQAMDVSNQIVAQGYLQAVLEQMPVGVVIAESPHGKIVTTNQQVEHILRHPALESDDIAAYGQWSGIRTDGTPVRGEDWPMARALTTGEMTWGEEFRYLRGDGTMAWISVNAAPIRDATGRIISAVVAFTDVTERRDLLDAEQSARRQAEQSANRLRRLLATTAALDNAVTREQVGEASLKIALTTVGAIAGMVVARADSNDLQAIARIGDPGLLPSADAPGPVAKTFRSGQPGWQAATRTNGDAGRAGALVTIPLVAHGDVVGVMSLRLASTSEPEGDDLDVLVGISAQAAQALERARLFDAEHAARRAAEEAVRSRDEFLSIASHELSTPVATLKASAQLLIRRLDRGELETEWLRRSCQIMNASADRLTQLTSELLDVARLRTGSLTLRLEQLNLVDHLTDAVEQFGQLSKQHSIDLEVFDDPLFIAGDPVRIDQVLANLLDNAIKYSPDGDVITVRVQPDGDGYLIAIHDQGIGIPDGAAESIFEPFGRAPNAVRNSYPGIGLGLHITRNIVLRHRGWLRAESPGEGRGTTVYVWFPADGIGQSARRD